MIEVIYKTDKAYSFHAFSLSELKHEVNQSMNAQPMSMADTLAALEGKVTQKDLASYLGVSTRYLRYIKTGARLSKQPEGRKGFKLKTKQGEKTRLKLFNLAKKYNLTLGGGYNHGSLRAANYLDLICEIDGEIEKDMHVLFYEHNSRNIKHMNDKGLYPVLQDSMRESIYTLCINSPCERVILYNRGNKHPKKKKLCKECEQPIISLDNKRLIYTVILVKH